jgi:drug/metabolite transporter (DMT)-like permease
MLALAATTWGGMFAVAKPLMAGMDPFTLTLVRYGFSAPIFLLLLLAVEGRGALATQGRVLRLWWLGTLGFAGFGLFALVGLGSTRPEHASVIPAMMPLITVGVMAMRKRAWPAPRALAAVALGLAGVVLAVTHGELRTLLAGGVGKGEALVLLGATCWVIYTLGAADFLGWSGLRYTALTCAFGTLSILAAELAALSAGIAELPTTATLVDAAPAFAYLVLAASVVAVLGWNAGMRAVGPARGVLFINLVPITAFVIAMLGGRAPAGTEIAGVALVIAALVLNSLGVSGATTGSARPAHAG